jgi:hypothetical protein
MILLYKSLKSRTRSTLVAVVLQNRRGLRLLTAEKGWFMFFFSGKDGWFFINKSGIVRDRIKKLKEKAQKLRSSYPTDILSSLYLWLILLVVPLIPVCLTLMFLSCLINIFQKFYRNILLPSPKLPRGTIQGRHASTNSPDSMIPPLHCPQPTGSRQKTKGLSILHITKSLQC